VRDMACPQATLRAQCRLPGIRWRRARSGQGDALAYAVTDRRGIFKSPRLYVTP
jgi:hypothetical protein